MVLDWSVYCVRVKRLALFSHLHLGGFSHFGPVHTILLTVAIRIILTFFAQT